MPCIPNRRHGGCCGSRARSSLTDWRGACTPVSQLLATAEARGAPHTDAVSVAPMGLIGRLPRGLLGVEEELRVLDEQPGVLVVGAVVGVGVEDELRVGGVLLQQVG